jgi:hypothetical protein
MVNLRKRFLLAFLVAVILGCAFGAITQAEEGDDDPGRIMVYYPGICIVLTPGSWWYDYFKCQDVMGEQELMSESVTHTLDDDGALTTEITRTHKDGSVSWLRRVQRQKAK